MPRKTKIGTEVAHVTRNSDTTFKIKRLKVNLQGAGHIVCGGFPDSLLIWDRCSGWYHAQIFVARFCACFSPAAVYIRVAARWLVDRTDDRGRWWWRGQPDGEAVPGRRRGGGDATPARDERSRRLRLLLPVQDLPAAAGRRQNTGQGDERWRRTLRPIRRRTIRLLRTPVLSATVYTQGAPKKRTHVLPQPANQTHKYNK